MQKHAFFLYMWDFLLYNNTVRKPQKIMIHEYSIFILEGHTDYEGGQVLGAYRTKADADAALDAYKAKAAARKYGNFDDYSVAEFILDAAADAYPTI